MFRPANKSFRRLASTSAHSVRAKSSTSHRALLAGAALASGAVTYTTLSTTYADAPNFYGNFKDAARTVEEEAESEVTASNPPTGPDWLREAVSREELITLAWGQNKNDVVAPHASSSDSVRAPSDVPWLRGVALRDLSLAEQYAACVDPKGDLYQWGTGFKTPGPVQAEPTAVLKGKDIISVTTTPTRIFALSSTGTVYVLPSTASPPTAQTPSSASWIPFLSGPTPTSDYTTLTPATPLSRGERITQLAAGKHHLLVLTSSGRVLGHALDGSANSHSQLGVRKVTLQDGNERDLVPAPPRMRGITSSQPTFTTMGAALVLPDKPTVRTPSVPTINEDKSDIRFSSTLHELPALRGLKIAQVAAGYKSSLARTEDGRVLAWGANASGQLGLGQVAVDVVIRPTEVVFDAGKGRRAVCTDIATGANLTFFIVERIPLASASTAEHAVDVLACGDGQFGGLGTALYSSAQGQPTRVRKVSGLTEFSEADQALRPILPHDIRVGPTGHVLLTLDTLAQAGIAKDGSAAAQAKEAGASPAGRDVMVWGANGAGELGNGKRSSVAVPQPILNRAGGHLMLTERAVTRVKALDGGEVRLKAKTKGGTTVVQETRAGYACSAVFWKVL